MRMGHLTPAKFPVYSILCMYVCMYLYLYCCAPETLSARLFCA